MKLLILPFLRRQGQAKIFDTEDLPLKARQLQSQSSASDIPIREAVTKPSFLETLLPFAEGHSCGAFEHNFCWDRCHDDVRMI